MLDCRALAGLFLAACTINNTAQGFECGAGTHAEGDACVVDSADTGVGGETGADSGSDTDTGQDSGGDTGKDTGTADYTVCDDGVAPFASLQEAVDAADDGDTVTVCPGVWPGFSIKRRDLTIRGLDAETTLVFGTTDSAITLEDSDLVLEGLSMRGGPVATVWAKSSTLEMRNFRLADNDGSYIVFADDSDVVWENCVVENNAVERAFDHTGYEKHTTSISHCVFRNNTNASSLVSVASPASITNNLFVGNSLADSGWLLNLYDVSASALYFENNTIVDNTTDTPEYSSLLYLSSVTFQGNILANNTTGIRQGKDREGQPSIVQYNDTFDNLKTDYTTFGGVGNVSGDPAFTDDAGGDWSLRYGYSACIDAGNPSAAYNDIDGSRNDMGAFGGPGGDWTPWE